MSKATTRATSGDDPSLDPFGRGEYDPQTGLWDRYEKDATPLGVVVGDNIRRLRIVRGLTQHELCQVWRRVGLTWARSKLAALESGTRPRIDAGELVLMAIGLEVQLSALFVGDESDLVALDSHLRYRVPRGQLRGLFTGETKAIEYDLATEQVGPADVDLARRLGVEPRVVAMAAAAIFDGRNLTEERDRRVRRIGELTAAQRQAHRGHVTRELAREIEAELKSNRSIKRQRGAQPRG